MRTKETPFWRHPSSRRDLEEFSKETLRLIEQNNLIELGICNKDNYLSGEARLFTSRDRDDYSRLGSCIGRNNNNELKSLYVQLEGIGLSAKDSVFFDGIKQNSSINKFRLNGYSDNEENNPIGEIGCALLTAFQTNNNLTTLRIWSCDLGNVDDRVVINTTLSSCTNLKTIQFNHNNTNCEQLLPMVEAIRGHRSMEVLKLEHNRIGNVGCQALTTLLQDPNCNLHTLILNHNRINNEGAIAIANSLANNNKLKKLDLRDNQIDNQHIVKVAFARLFCNTTSINSIHSSNHTLIDLETQGNIATRLHSLLQMNQCKNKSHVAMIKILNYYPNMDMGALFEWGSRDERNLMSLPYVIDWFDRAEEAIETITFEREKTEGYNTEERKLSAIYQFALAMPMMFIPSSHTKVEDKKIAI